MPTEKLLGRGRSREIALPRQIVMYLLREDADISLPRIGEILGGRDHTTVLYGVGKIEGQLEEDSTLRREVIAMISDPFVVRKILSHLGLPTEPPRVAPARPPPQSLIDFACQDDEDGLLG